MAGRPRGREQGRHRSVYLTAELSAALERSGRTIPDLLRQALAQDVATVARVQAAVQTVRARRAYLWQLAYELACREGTLEFGEGDVEELRRLVGAVQALDNVLLGLHGKPMDATPMLEEPQLARMKMGGFRLADQFFGGHGAGLDAALDELERDAERREMRAVAADLAALRRQRGHARN